MLKSADEPIHALAELVTEQAAPAIEAATLTRINAQRQVNGKREPIDLADLVRQAEQAGITPQAAAEWILARPSRNFFRADFATQAPSQPAPMDAAAKAQARARSEAVQADLLRRSIEAMRAPVQVTRPKPPAARHAIPSASSNPIGNTVTLGGATGTSWARAAVDRFMAGQTLSHFTLTNAADALGLSLSDLKAQRAATQQTAGAAA